MRRKVKNPYRKGQDPREWLENVLSTWTVFCEVNCSLANAISDLLDENEKLRQQLTEKEKAAEATRDQF